LAFSAPFSLSAGWSISGSQLAAEDRPAKNVIARADKEDAGAPAKPTVISVARVLGQATDSAACVAQS